MFFHAFQTLFLKAFHVFPCVSRFYTVFQMRLLGFALFFMVLHRVSLFVVFFIAFHGCQGFPCFWTYVFVGCPCASHGF